MKTGTAVKVYSIIMGLLLLFALVMTGGNVKAADNEAMTIQIQPGDEKIEIYNDYYVLNGSTRQDWSGRLQRISGNRRRRIQQQWRSEKHYVKQSEYSQYHQQRNMRLQPSGKRRRQTSS